MATKPWRFRDNSRLKMRKRGCELAPEAIPADIDNPMSEEANPHLAERARKAAKIISEPTQFKVCEGCESIVASRVVICPNCYGYRFNEDPAAVVEQAKLLASREQTSVIADDLT